MLPKEALDLSEEDFTLIKEKIKTLVNIKLDPYIRASLKRTLKIILQTFISKNKSYHNMALGHPFDYYVIKDYCRFEEINSILLQKVNKNLELEELDNIFSILHKISKKRFYQIFFMFWKYPNILIDSVNHLITFLKNNNNNFEETSSKNNKNNENNKKNGGGDINLILERTFNLLIFYFNYFKNYQRINPKNVENNVALNMIFNLLMSANFNLKNRILRTLLILLKTEIINYNESKKSPSIIIEHYSDFFSDYNNNKKKENFQGENRMDTEENSKNEDIQLKLAIEMSLGGNFDQDSKIEEENKPFKIEIINYNITFEIFSFACNFVSGNNEQTVEENFGIYFNLIFNLMQIHFSFLQNNLINYNQEFYMNFINIFLDYVNYFY